jgi:peptide/nickel transport system permease protein
VVTAIISVLIGTVLGGAAGYFGGWVDHLVVWLYTTFSSIPNLVLLVVIAYAFTAADSDVKDTLLPVYIAFCATFWIGTCRVIRGETMKLKQLEYIQAARTAGFGNMRVLFRHVLPNTSHLMLINFSLLLIGAIKSEVILSYLGLGVKSQPSWGIMIRDAGNNGDVMTGFFWQIGTATVLMFFLVLAFNILSDALQDAFDPKHL